jgi:hypothetical protein
LLKIVEAIIKGGVALSGLPPAAFVVAINELRQIIVNIHIFFLQQTCVLTFNPKARLRIVMVQHFVRLVGV